MPRLELLAGGAQGQGVGLFGEQLGQGNLLYPVAVPPDVNQVETGRHRLGQLGTAGGRPGLTQHPVEVDGGQFHLGVGLAQLRRAAEVDVVNRGVVGLDANVPVG